MTTTNLPLKRVVLFSSGVGYFEHAGTVEDDAQVSMRFDVDDVNDLLKSMVVQDFGGGRVSTVSYGSKDPITRTLKTFAVDLTDKPTLAELLDQVRGERVEIQAHDALAGVIVGIEERRRKTKDEEFLVHYVLNLLADDGLRAVPLDSISHIRLANAKLDAELRQALATLATSHSVDKKTVTVHFMGEGERPVRIGYVRETPVWKTSYRLVLENDRAPFLQGWAIVENTTDEDWKDIELTLVSGRPVSFVMDLYEPLYLKRPVVKPDLHASLRPQTYDQDMSEVMELAGSALADEPLLQKKLAKRGGMPADARLSANRVAELEMAGRPERFDLREGVQAMVSSGEVGELFQYAIDTPVSLERQQSAMLPIVNAEIEGERISIYNQAVHAKHPLVGLKLTNTTPLHLMQGPITVFDEQVYAGDARIEDVPAGAQRLVSYALDLDVEVAPETDMHPETIASARLADGTMQVTLKHVRRQHFTVKNSGNRTKNVLVESPTSQGWTLLTPSEPAEKTRDRYRFAVDAQPGSPETLVVEEELVLSRQLALSSINGKNVQVFLSARLVTDEVKAALQEILRRKQELGALSDRKKRLETRITTIAEEQERIRKNMGSLDHASELYRRYVKTLNEQEDSITSLHDQVQELVDKQTELQRGLEQYIAGLELP
jgi:hypothetical protein